MGQGQGRGFVLAPSDGKGFDVRSAERSISAILKKQGYHCALTGRELTPEVASVDHRVPVTRGGGLGLENVWLLHEDVNRAKGTMTAEEFIAMCAEVVSYQERSKSAEAVALPATTDGRHHDQKLLFEVSLSMFKSLKKPCLGKHARKIFQQFSQVVVNQ
jgi:hypothetical protein